MNKCKECVYSEPLNGTKNVILCHKHKVYIKIDDDFYNDCEDMKEKDLI